MRRILAIAFWSVIAAAFIGPGTVTTAALAGARHGLSLLWALTFATVACFVLQEAAARLTIVTGRDLGEALRERFPGIAIVGLVVGAIVVGCAAYEAGNLLGAAAGIGLALPVSPRAATAGLAVVAAAALWNRPPDGVAKLLSLLVAVMGLAFLWTAVALQPPVGALVRGALVPSRPEGSDLIVLGLVGTTVVPYNLFLGSGIAAGQRLREMRFGLAVAVGLGGLISMGILVVGTAVNGPFGFRETAGILSSRLGPGSSDLFAAGLAAAGLSSAITAPLAAAVTARGLFSASSDDPRWSARGARFRAVWGSVLAVGIVFGLSGLRPIPVILLAQALNGVLLPVAATFLLVAVHERGRPSSPALAAIVLVTVFLGTDGVLRATHSALGLPPPEIAEVIVAGLVAAAGLSIPVVRGLRRRNPS